MAWLAARNLRPPVGLIAAVLLSAFCLISLMFGLFDGDLINNVASAGFISWGVVWGVVLLSVTAAVVCLPRPGRGSCTGCADAPVFRLAGLPIPAGAAPVHASGLLVVGGDRLPADGVQRGLGSPNPET